MLSARETGAAGRAHFRAMLDRKHWPFGWIDILWLVFLLGLALLPPIDEIHKQLTILAIGILQLFEGRLVAWRADRGRAYAVILKILLATLLIDHTGELGINSEYYPIYYLPVVTAAIYFGPIATLFWTALAALAYCSFLIPALQEFELTPEGAAVLTIRILFFFIAAVLINRFVMENRRRTQQYQELSETLEETNLQLRRAEADARRAERLAALGQLSAGLAHEIRNPLGVIKGSAEMLAQKVQNSSPLAAELAGYIGAEVNRLNALVARFLDFARPSHLEVRPEHVKDVVERALDAAKAQFPNAHVRIERNYSANIPDVKLDSQLCERVFANLITNAYDAMGGSDASGLLKVSIEPESSSGKPGVGVTIEDTGPGVPTELREQIFNPFVTSKQSGVGLGLSIVAKIVDDHRGSIKLESQDGVGARFHVFLPDSPDV